MNPTEPIWRGTYTVHIEQSIRGPYERRERGWLCFKCAGRPKDPGPNPKSTPKEIGTCTGTMSRNGSASQPIPARIAGDRCTIPIVALGLKGVVPTVTARPISRGYTNRLAVSMKSAARPLLRCAPTRTSVRASAAPMPSERNLPDGNCEANPKRSVAPRRWWTDFSAEGYSSGRASDPPA